MSLHCTATISLPNPKNTPESKYPAENEDIDTIITGPDGQDYVVDIVDGLRSWIVYLPHEDDMLIIKKILPRIDDTQIIDTNKDINTKKPNANNKESNGYQKFMNEMVDKIKQDNPEIAGTDRIKMIRSMWADRKEQDKLKSKTKK